MTLKKMASKLLILGGLCLLLYPFVSDKWNLLHSSRVVADYTAEVDRMEEELGRRTTVVATGGLAKKIVPYCKRKIILDEELLLKGLHYIYQRNC